MTCTKKTRYADRNKLIPTAYSPVSAAEDQISRPPHIFFAFTRPDLDLFQPFPLAVEQHSTVVKTGNTLLLSTTASWLYYYPSRD